MAYDTWVPDAAYEILQELPLYSRIVFTIARLENACGRPDAALEAARELLSMLQEMLGAGYLLPYIGPDLISTGVA